MFSMIALVSLLSSAPTYTYTTREVVIVSKAPTHTVCHTRDLVQGSGSVKICSRGTR